MSRKHNSKTVKLNRNYNQRQALFKNQLIALIQHGQISTTLAKAKVIKRMFDSLTSKAVAGTLSKRRSIAASLSNPKAANRLVDLIAPTMKDRTSGFTTIKKTSIRRGDATPIATLSLIVPLPEPTPIEDKKAPQKAAKAAPKKETKKTTSK